MKAGMFCTEGKGQDDSNFLGRNEASRKAAG